VRACVRVCACVYIIFNI